MLHLNPSYGHRKNSSPFMSQKNINSLGLQGLAHLPLSPFISQLLPHSEEKPHCKAKLNLSGLRFSIITNGVEPEL